jgi:hypothetical protein
MTPVPESGTRREPVEPAIGVSVFTNLMACFRYDGCKALSIRSMSTGDSVTLDLDPAEIAAMLAEESPYRPTLATAYSACAWVNPSPSLDVSCWVKLELLNPPRAR